MSYSALTLRKMPISLDGTIAGWNLVGFGSGLANVFSSTEMTQLDGESPAKDTSTAMSFSSTGFLFAIFPELRDLTGLLFHDTTANGIASLVVQTSPDTTNGADGTWTTITVTGSAGVNGLTTDWWRSNPPATLSGAVTGIKGLRASWGHFANNAGQLRGLHIFGAKSSGQTVDDVIFLGTGLTTEITADYDYGDIAAGSATHDATLALKNVSATHTANSIVLDFQGSYPGDYTVSIDGGSTFASTKTITSLAAGAQQTIIIRFAPPAAAAGNYIPRAGNIRAVVGSWT